MSSVLVTATVNYSTNEEQPYQVNIEVPPLRITHVSIGFPAGCCDLVEVWISYLSAQIYPANQGAKFIGNGQIIGFDTDTTVSEDPKVVTINYANLDDTYNHKIWVLFDVEFLEISGLQPQEAINISSDYPVNREVKI